MFIQASTLQTLMARLPLAVSVLLVVLLGIRGAALVTDFTGGTRRPAATPQNTPAGLALSGPADLAALIGANLFGAADPGLAPGAAPPVTSIPLVLVGVMAAQDPAQGVAILGPAVDSAKVHLVGSALPGGATLAAVYPDRVLINRGGVIEALLLPRQSAATGRTSPPVAVPGLAERAQQLVQQNPSAITSVMRPQVVLVDGKQKGFRVFPGPNRQAFSRLGLQAGDLVTTINGTTLDDPSVGSSVFATLATSPNARVTVVRDGRTQDLVVNVVQALAEAERPPVSQGPTLEAETIPSP